MTSRVTTPALLMVLATFLAGCASDPGVKPTDKLSAATTAVEQADDAGAGNQEPVLLNEAKTKVADARELIGAKKYDEARRKLEQAAVDAQLAEARAETQKVRTAVGELNSTIESLRQNLEMEQQ